MAIAKIILNGVTQMDVTQKTVTSADMLNGVTALKNDGTDITGSIAAMTLPSASSSTSSGTSKATITPGSAAQYLNIPAGYLDTAQYYTIAAGGSGGLILLATSNIGTVNTSSTTAQSLSKSVTVTSFGGYDLLIVETTADPSLVTSHVGTVRPVALTTAGSSIATSKGSAQLGNISINYKKNDNYITSRSSTTIYGVFPNTVTISGDGQTLTLDMYARYYNTHTGAINGAYTVRVYGVNLYSLING